jgi:hypothetical protein
MADVKTWVVVFDATGTIVSSKEIDVELGTQVVVVRAKNLVNANKAALALRGE